MLLWTMHYCVCLCFFIALHIKNIRFYIKINTRGETSMEKNRMRPVKAGKSMRMSYSRQKEVLEMPNLIEVQKDSYQWFLDEGLKEVFDDISPIADYNEIGRASCRERV